MTYLIRSTALLAALLTFACGDDDSGPSTKPVEDQATIDQSQDTARKSEAFTQLPAGADESAAQPVITTVGQSVQTLVSRHQAAQAQAMAQGLSVRYDAQVMEGGDFSFDGGHLVADVNYANGATSIHYQVDLQIDIADGAGSLDGTYAFDFSSSQGVYDVSTQYDVNYDALTFSGGCTSGGTMTVDYAFEVSGDALANLPPAAREQVAAGVGGGGRIVAQFNEDCSVTVEGS